MIAACRQQCMSQPVGGDTIPQPLWITCLSILCTTQCKRAASHDSNSDCTWIAPDWKRVCRMSWSAGCMASCRYPMPCFSRSLSRTSFTRSINASMSLSWACMHATHVRSCHRLKYMPHISWSPTCAISYSQTCAIS